LQKIAKKTCRLFWALHSRRSRALHALPSVSRFHSAIGNIFPAIVLLVSGLLLALQDSGSGQTVFSQNFSGGTNVSDYVGSGANLFDAISTANSTNLSWSIASGTLQGVRSANSGGAVTRTTDLATSLGAIYRFDINVVDITTAATSTLAFYVGSGFNTLK
jgi:hypothetical protein